MNDILNKFSIEKQPVDRGLEWLQKIWRLLGIILWEAQSKAPLSVRDSLKAWRQGFMRKTYLLYELDKHDPQMFINDFAQYLKMDRINGAHRAAGVHKVIFSRYVESLGAPCPSIHALIVRGNVYALHEMEATGLDILFKLVGENPSGIVLKPIIGCEGSGIVFLKCTGRDYEINGKTATKDDVKALIKALDDYLITDFVIQHEYANGLYPRTTNTLRLLTLWDYEKDQPFLAAAVQRIGSSRSYPVDNFKMGAGGLSALVDSETGKLGCGVQRSNTGSLQRYTCHPETDNQIDGVYVPRWRETAADILRFSAMMPYLPLIGWDIVMTPKGYQVIETNPGSGLYVIQVHHQPFLEDKRIKLFFEVHRCLREKS